MSRHIGKPAICIGENKGADQLRSNCEADQRVCFRYTDSAIPLLYKFKISSRLACFCTCTGRFVSDLFGNTLLVFPGGGSIIGLFSSFRTSLLWGQRGTRAV